MFVQLDLPLWRVQNNSVAEIYLTVDEARERLGVGRQYIYDAIKRGDLKAIKDPETRTWLVSGESILKYQKPRTGRPSKRKTSY